MLNVEVPISSQEMISWGSYFLEGLLVKSIPVCKSLDEICKTVEVTLVFDKDEHFLKMPNYALSCFLESVLELQARGLQIQVETR